MFSPGIRIYQYRLRKGVTQAQLASQCGIPQPNLSNIEKGKQDLTVSTLIRIAGALEVRPSQLMEEEASDTKAPALTRTTIEAIAEAVINPKAKVSKEIHYWASLFRKVLPQNYAHGVSSLQKTNMAWLEIKKHFTPQEIKGVSQRVEDEAQRTT